MTSTQTAKYDKGVMVEITVLFPSQGHVPIQVNFHALYSITRLCSL